MIVSTSMNENNIFHKVWLFLELNTFTSVLTLSSIVIQDYSDAVRLANAIKLQPLIHLSLSFEQANSDSIDIIVKSVSKVTGL